MSLIHAFVTLASISAGIVYGQQSEKGNSIIPFPRVGRSDRYFMSDKRNGNSMSPGLIPFPRIGRSEGFHEMKRQLIPFPRVGKRPFWHYPADAYNIFEYEDYPYMVDPNGASPMGSASIDPSSTMPDEIDNDKRSTNAEKGMWFGPRLGKRRKRSISESDSYEPSRDTSVDTKTLVKILRSFKWAIVPVRERRTFTPRLGRSSEEITIHSRAQPFSPRLGRSREVSSVELDLEEKGSSRLSRGEIGSDIRGGHEKGTEPPASDVILTPRLVRDHFSPRLGRSGEDHE